MRAISSEIVHILKVKLFLQNDQRWLLLLPWFSKFLGGGSPNPSSRLEKYLIYFSTHTAQHKPLVKSEAFNQGEKNKIDLRLWAINLLAKDVLHPFHTIIYHNMDLKIRIR